MVEETKIKHSMFKVSLIPTYLSCSVLIDGTRMKMGWYGSPTMMRFPVHPHRNLTKSLKNPGTKVVLLKQ
eukprot:scaffold610_cov169-Ochromonas_danica.AAC.11